MSIFIDTGMVVAAMNRSDVNHDHAMEIFNEIKEGHYGTPYSSNYIMDEAVTLALKRSRKRRIALKVGKFFIAEDPDDTLVKMLYVDGDIVQKSWEYFEKYDVPLSFTDWTIVAQVDSLGIDHVASFDSDLDPWVERIG